MPARCSTATAAPFASSITTEAATPSERRIHQHQWEPTPRYAKDRRVPDRRGEDEQTINTSFDGQSIPTGSAGGFVPTIGDDDVVARLDRRVADTGEDLGKPGIRDIRHDQSDGLSSAGPQHTPNAIRSVSHLEGDGEDPVARLPFWRAAGVATQGPGHGGGVNADPTGDVLHGRHRVCPGSLQGGRPTDIVPLMLDPNASLSYAVLRPIRGMHPRRMPIRAMGFLAAERHRQD